jgi:hypothetical protein
MHRVRVALLGFAIAALLGAPVSSGGQQRPSEPSQDSSAREFTEQDALHVLQGIGDALESNNEQRFLSQFDAGKMADYATFRDQVHAFFQQYESFLVSYHVQQVAREAADGIILADFTVDARPTGGDQPDVRKSVQLRLVVAWDGKTWKITGLSPRDLFS